MAALTFPREALMDAEGRDRRCAQSLRMDSLRHVFSELSSEDHVLAFVTGETCSLCRDGVHCPHKKDQFNSTDNSKRRISTLLFWKVRLGVDFPVPDSLLKDAWKCLDSCDLGIK
jgi:hypothetical protein